MVSENYYVINSQFQKSEYASLALALQSSNRLLVVVQRAIPYSQNEEDKLKYDFEFVNENSTELTKKIKIGEWTAYISSIYDQEKKTDFKPIFVGYSADGQLRQILVGNNRGYLTITKIIEKLMELKRFKSWQEYDLHSENTSLKLTIEQLRSELNELKSARQ